MLIRSGVMIIWKQMLHVCLFHYILLELYNLAQYSPDQPKFIRFHFMYILLKIQTNLNGPSDPQQFEHDFLHCKIQTLLCNELDNFDKYVEGSVSGHHRFGASVCLNNDREISMAYNYVFFKKRNLSY